MYQRKEQFDDYLDTDKAIVMNGIVWLTINAAAKEPECLVTGETLRQMIKSNKVPVGHYMVVPYGKKFIYYIDKAILPSLPYQSQGRKPKDRKS